MADTLDALIQEESGQLLLREGTKSREPEQLADDFSEVLRRMTRAERISASRHGGFTRWERWLWVARLPDEVPLVNGEFEWITWNMADLDPD